jgi:hypothetical protein
MSTQQNFTASTHHVPSHNIINRVTYEGTLYTPHQTVNKKSHHKNAEYLHRNKMFILHNNKGIKMQENARQQMVPGASPGSTIQHSITYPTQVPMFHGHVPGHQVRMSESHIIRM